MPLSRYFLQPARSAKPRQCFSAQPGFLSSASIIFTSLHSN
nr:MAG TPA: hypothetical protein [Caudoviricetes sp.]